ncbi:MAG: 1,4-dihydroxy-2-naphthoate octaprenyltransferase, partial [Flavobacteriaceae bacterium]
LLFGLMILTAATFQIVSNFANDYGDGVKGTDNDERVGPKRILQEGLLSRTALKRAIALTSVIALILAVWVIIMAFGKDSIVYIMVFLAFSILSVWAAISYTVGDKAYGYRGMGDLFVLLFFGGLSVLGSHFVQVKLLTDTATYLSLAIGFLSVGVLNLNNMRDRESDGAVGKNTIAVFLGAQRSKRYHLFLILASIFLIVFVFLQSKQKLFWLPLFALIPLGIHIGTVIKNKDAKKLDPELKKLALTTFLLSILIFITFYIG